MTAYAPLYIITTRIDLKTKGSHVIREETVLSPASFLEQHMINLQNDRDHMAAFPDHLIVSSISWGAQVTPEEARLCGFDENGELPQIQTEPAAA